jgi:thioredoxin 1
MIEVTDSTFEAEVLLSPVPVLVDFHSFLCGPCNRQKAILADLSDDIGDRARIVTVEILMNEGLAERYGIAALPTLIVFKDGREVQRLVGLKTKDYLREALAV